MLARLAMALLLAAAPLVTHAQPGAKVHRIGFVTPVAASPEAPSVREFRRALRELGYVEGTNIAIEARFAEGRPERFPELIAELIKQKVDVIVVASNAGAHAAKQATSKLPIVFAGVADAIASGIVENLARPGGNITGTTIEVAESGIEGKRLELLKEAIPRMTHAAVLFDGANPQAAAFLREIDNAAQKLRVKVSRYDAGTVAALDTAFAAIGASGAQALIVTGSAIFGGNRERLVRLVAEKRIPAIYFFSLFPDAGGLMSYGGSGEDSHRRAALQVDKILKGAKPGDLPVDQATKFELVINLKSAQAMGLTIPRPLLMKADRVIE